MKLLSTEFRENSIELIYADSPDAEAAATLVHVRLPRDVDHSKRIAWNRYWALGDLQELIRAARDADRALAEKEEE